jgi:hypothetical protein
VKRGAKKDGRENTSKKYMLVVHIDKYPNHIVFRLFFFSQALDLCCSMNKEQNLETHPSQVHILQTDIIPKY